MTAKLSRCEYNIFSPYPNSQPDMARKIQEQPQLNLRQALHDLTVSQLKTYFEAACLDAPQGKDALVDELAGFLENEANLRKVYASLDELAQRALQEATHNPMGRFHPGTFVAKYGNEPPLSIRNESSYTSKPTKLGLLFPQYRTLPCEVQAILRTFVPPPQKYSLKGIDEVPATYRLTPRYRETSGQEVPLRVRETERAAQLDLKAVLRLIDSGEVKVGESTRRPSQASIQAIVGVLSEGDFYTADDVTTQDDAGADLTMQPFAWPLLVQAGGLASLVKTKLQLSPAGCKALTREPHEVLKVIWSKWLKTPLIDELNRCDTIKGQQSRGALTAVPPRRATISAALAHCPVGKWCSLNDLFRQLNAADEKLVVRRDNWKLYFSEPYHGSLGQQGGNLWNLVEGRYTLALLFEYAATLGLIDVAYVPPAYARRAEFSGCWGTDDDSCLSRYDGLIYLRVNALGAWCLGLADHYTPRVVVADRTLKILPNLDVVAPDKAPSQADVLFLDRFTERQSEAVWHLSKEKVLAAIEQGFGVYELREFLTTRAQELPHTVDVFLSDLEQRAGQIVCVRPTMMLTCKDALVAQTLVSDRRLKALCQLAGDRHLVFATSDEAAVRRALRDLGYAVPPPR